MTRKFLLFAFSAATILSSCKKDREDTIAPSVFLVRVNGADGQTSVGAGDTITFYAEIKDNVNLKQYQIDIHDAFDGHDHRNATYSTQLVYNVSGTAVYETKTIIIPSTAYSGPYHIVVTAVDEAGLSSNVYQYDLTITQAEQPVLTITSHNVDSIIAINANDTIYLAGTVTDNTDLDSVNIWLQNSVGIKVYTEENYLAGASDALFTINSPVTGAIIAGAYKLVFRIRDNDGNLVIKETDVNVQ